MCTSNSHAFNMHTNARQRHARLLRRGPEVSDSCSGGVQSQRWGCCAPVCSSAVEDSSHLKVCRNVGAAAPSGAAHGSPPFLPLLSRLPYCSLTTTLQNQHLRFSRDYFHRLNPFPSIWGTAASDRTGNLNTQQGYGYSNRLALFLSIP